MKKQKDRLEALLERTIKRHGEDAPTVQMLRDQISAEKRGALTDYDIQKGFEKTAKKEREKRKEK